MSLLRSKSPVIVGIGVVLLGLKLLLLIAKTQSHDSYGSYGLYGSGHRYGGLGRFADDDRLDPDELNALVRELGQNRYAPAAPAAVPSETTAVRAGSCGAPGSAGHLDVLPRDAAERTAFNAAFEAGSSQLPALEHSGLAVAIRQGDRYCLDATAHDVELLVLNSTQSLDKREAGVWVATAEDGSLASIALDGQGLRRELKPRGPLLAFMVDNSSIALADGANPQAAVAAADYVSEHAANQRCVSGEVLKLSGNNRWERWAAPAGHPARPALARMRAKALECQRADTLRLVRLYDQRREEAPDEPWAKATAHGAIVTVRTLENGQVSQFLDPQYRQLIASSDVVEVNGGSAPMPWEQFQKQYRQQLLPFELAGQKLPGYWVFGDVHSM